jgi:hypothetical protein
MVSDISGSLVGKYEHNCIQGSSLIALIMEAERTSETSVSFNENTWHNIPDDRNIYYVLYFQLFEVSVIQMTFR